MPKKRHGSVMYQTVQRLASFFRVYKQLPEGRKKVELSGFNDAATAKQEIKQAWDAWKAKNPQ